MCFNVGVHLGHNLCVKVKCGSVNFFFSHYLNRIINVAAFSVRHTFRRAKCVCVCVHARVFVCRERDDAVTVCVRIDFVQRASLPIQACM